MNARHAGSAIARSEMGGYDVGFPMNANRAAQQPAQGRRTDAKPARPSFSFGKPSREAAAGFRARNASVDFGYAEIGQSNGGAPAGYVVDHNRARLGRGEEAWRRACAALRAWRMFPAPWTAIEPADAPIRVGETLAMLAHAHGLWWMNGCRIVYTIDETAGPVKRFGFAYGTLPAHVEQGEERFLVEMLADGTVWYDLRAFSRPRFWLVRLTKPLARRLQRRFARESLAAMRAAVGETGDASDAGGTGGANESRGEGRA